VEHLLNRGEKNVTAFDIRKTFEDPRVKFVVGDISKLSDLTKAFEGVDTGKLSVLTFTSSIQ
jgi:hypothetical protein